MLLVVAMVIVALDSTGVASQIADAVEREICRVATGETCGKDAASDRLRSEPRRRPAERLKLRETRRVSRDLALGVPVRRMPRAQTSHIWKKVACKAAGAPALGVNVAR